MAILARGLEDIDKKLQAEADAGNYHAGEYMKHGISIKAVYYSDPTHEEGLHVHMEEDWAEIRTYTKDTTP